MGTYTILDVVEAVAAKIPRVTDDKYIDLIANATQSAIWNRFDWRETIADLPPFWCIPDVQDYGAPAVIVPPDFQGLRTAYQIDVLNWPRQPWPLKPVRELGLSANRSLSDAISFDKGTQSFRLSRLPSGDMTAPRWLVAGTYKIEPVKITKSNYATTALFSEDQYFEVWVTQMKAKAAAYLPNSGDKDALLQEAEIELLKMASNEGFNLGETPIAPDSALVQSGWGMGAGGWAGWAP